MKNDKNHVEIFTNDSIITLYDGDTPIDFYEVAGIEYEERFYELLQPYEKTEGIAEDEAVIFECVTDSDSGEKLFKPVFDEKLSESIFELYLIAASDFAATDCGGGCSDGGCGGSCVSQNTEVAADMPAKPAAEKPSSTKKTPVKKK